MHDGSLATLEAVVDHYAGKLIVRPGLNSSIVRGLNSITARRPRSSHS